MKSQTLDMMMQSETIYSGLEQLLLGTYLEPCETTINGYTRFETTREVWNKLRVIRRLENLCREYVIPERFAYETIRIMTKKNRHWYSYKNQIRVLLSILDRDDNYIYFPKARAIKARFEGVSGT